MNEALPYVEAVHEIYKGEATGVRHVPGLDGHRPALPQPLPVRRARRRASRSRAAGTSTARSRRPTPSPSWPREIDVPAEALRGDRRAASTASPTSGVDEDFHRGEIGLRQVLLRPTVKPNPSLHAIDQAPFYAVKIVPGDLGTKGGLVTDERARVLRAGRLGDPRPVRRRQRLVRGDGPHLRRPRRHHRPGADVRLPRRRRHRRHGGDLRCPSTRQAASAPTSAPPEFSWTSSDVLLYHLGIGAGSRPGDNLDPDALRYTLDGPALQVLPSFGVVVPTFHETDPPPLDLPGCDINLAQVVHGSQSISVDRTAADVRLRDRVDDAHRHLGQGQGRA